MPRKRLPTDVLKATGRKHLSRAEEQERRASEVRAPAPKQIRCPKWLGEKYRDDFRKYARQLAALGLYSELDADTLGRYLVSHDLWLTAAAQLLTASEQEDTEMVGKWLKAEGQAFKQAQTCANDLGMTITSRCRLVIPKAEEEASDEMAILLTFPGAAANE